MVLDGDHGGHVTSSHLQLTLTAQHHGAVVTCDAFNEIVGKRIHDSITLSVNRKLIIFSWLTVIVIFGNNAIHFVNL
jgi:hypothetical protein